MTIGDDEKLVSYAAGIRERTPRGKWFALRWMVRTDKINGKMLGAEESKVHTMLVIGPRDMEAGNVSVRLHGKGNMGAKPKGEVIAEILEDIKTRK